MESSNFYDWQVVSLIAENYIVDRILHIWQLETVIIDVIMLYYVTSPLVLGVT